MEKRGIYTILISLIVALGGFLLGFDSAVISGAVPFIQPYFKMTDLQLGWSVSCLIFGAMFGNAVAGPLSDKLGRKHALIITAIFFSISAISSALATNFWFFVFARILGGIGVGGAILIAPIYIAEIAPSKKRGQLVSFNQLNIVIGISAAYWSNYFLLNLESNNWRWMLGVEAIPATLYFILLFLVPKSPRWLINKGKDQEALSIMEKIGGSEYAKKSLEAIKKSQLNIIKKASLKDLFNKRMSTIMLIALGLAFFQQITGINAIFYYAPSIFAKTGGGTENAFMQSIVIGIVNFIFTIVAIRYIDRLGRKPLLLIGTLTMGIALFINASAFNFARYKIDQSSLLNLEKNLPAEIFKEIKSIEGIEFKNKEHFISGVTNKIGSESFERNRTVILDESLNINAKLVLIGIILYIAAFAVSLGPVMWTILSEVFPNQLRGLAISISGLFNSLISFSVTFIFPWELNTLGPDKTFLIYGVFAIMAFVFTWYFIPETKGKSLEELEVLLINTDDKKKDSVVDVLGPIKS